MKKILILLSTYNGERFLKEQLDSLYEQEGVDIHILVRDDGSSDNTLAILAEYQKQFGKLTVLAKKNIGASLSFHRLLAEACLNYSGFEYYAFCDQDDVWLSDKLITAVTELERSSQTYKLYYGAATLVNAKLQKMNRSSGTVINNLPANIVASHSLGCTQVFNNALMKKVSILGLSLDNLSKETYIPLHDGWTALVAYSMEAQVIYDSCPHILYRQHGNNVVGGGGSFLERQKSRIMRYNKKRNIKSRKCALLVSIFSDEIPPKNINMLSKCANYQSSFKKKLSLLFDRDLYQYDLITNIGLFNLVLLNKF